MKTTTQRLVVVDMTKRYLLYICVFSLSVSHAFAQERWDPRQREILSAIETLSAATRPGGGGADAYGAVLAEEFARWTMGSDVINEKTAWVAGIAEWYEQGWRVVGRQSDVLQITVLDAIAFSRRIVAESLEGPGGERSESLTALTEVWVRRDGAWLLWRVDLTPVDGS